jgi:hypothetical protein
MAVNLHGVPRNTHDLDLYVDLEPRNILKAVGVLGKLGLKPQIPERPEAIADPENRERWIREKYMKVFNFVDVDDPIHPVDILVVQPVAFEEAWSRRQYREEESERVPLLSIQDLITLKEAAGRRQDLADIEMLRVLDEEKDKKG